MGGVRDAGVSRQENDDDGRDREPGQDGAGQALRVLRDEHGRWWRDIRRDDDGIWRATSRKYPHLTVAKKTPEDLDREMRAWSWTS